MSKEPDAKAPSPIPGEPVGRHGLDNALLLFVDRFVVADKRQQIHKRLLAAERRGETLGSLPRWLAGTTAPLEGRDRSPAGLRARLGDVVGVHLDEVGARRTTIADALELGRDRASLFVGDTGRIALITVAGGAPILCSWL